MRAILAAMAGGVIFGTLFPSLRPNLASYGRLFMALLQMCALPMLSRRVVPGGLFRQTGAVRRMPPRPGKARAPGLRHRRMPSLD